MAEKVKQSKWRLVLTYVTVVFLVIFVIAIHRQILSTFHNLKQVDIYALVALIPIEFFNYHAQAKLYQESLEVIGKKLTYRFLYRVSLELNFVSTLLPSGGISGFSYLNLRLKSKGISAADSSIIQIIKLMLIFFAFQLLLLFGLLTLAIGGRVNGIMILISTSIITLLVILTFGMVFVIGSKRRIESFFTYITKIINRIIKVFRPAISETINIESAKKAFGELHENYMHFRHNYKELRSPFGNAFLANATECAAVYAVYVAFGHWVNPGAVIMAYAVANFSGFISVLPGGVGVYETIMTLILAAAGISPSLTIPVVIMYRVVNTLIQIIPGYYYYQRNLKGHGG
jgi:uncharacterized protein (TIRG00374 family)